MMKMIGFGLLIAYFGIAAYSNVKSEVRYWLGYPMCEAQKSTNPEWFYPDNAM